MTEFKDKSVVVTGAANGLGKALAIEFLNQGCHLALIDIDFAGLQNLLVILNRKEQLVTIHQADISNEESIIKTRLEILNTHKQIDILVNNAGISINQYFEHIDLVDYKMLFDTNFWGTVYCTKHFLPDLKSQNDSRVVNIISDFALMGFPGKTAYGSSKSAVWGFTNALKTELADTSVKVCMVIPPPLDTGLVRDGKHIDDKKKQTEARFVQKHSRPLDTTAKKIVQQIRKGKFRIVIGAMMFGIDLISRLFPTLLHTVIGKYKKRIEFI